MYTPKRVTRVIGAFYLRCETVSKICNLATNNRLSSERLRAQAQAEMVTWVVAFLRFRVVWRTEMVPLVD